MQVWCGDKRFVWPIASQLMRAALCVCVSVCMYVCVSHGGQWRWQACNQCCGVYGLVCLCVCMCPEVKEISYRLALSLLAALLFSLVPSLRIPVGLFTGANWRQDPSSHSVRPRHTHWDTLTHTQTSPWVQNPTVLNCSQTCRRSPVQTTNKHTHTLEPDRYGERYGF